MLQKLIQNATHSHTIIANQQAMIHNQQETLGQLQDIAAICRLNQTIPAQVPLSNPVVFLDACGRYAPFHLEFVDSAEVCALWSVSSWGVLDLIATY